jgi:tetratricopeptide (TPR) repeat protein
LEQTSLNSIEASDLLFEKYNKMYEANPLSTVFAPLAECFRKMGRKDKALSILRAGIKNHPDYLLGYLGLAQCYFDLEQFNLAYNTLRPLIEKNRENIRLQRLFAKICEKTNHEVEALESYKYLLFLNPKDSDAAFNVRNLEDPLLKKLEVKKAEPKAQNPFIFSDSDENKWETVSFQKMEILDRLAYSSEKKGDLDKAAEFVELSLTFNPKDIWAKNRKKTLTSNDSSNKTLPKSTLNSSKKVQYKLLNFLDKIKKRSGQIRSQLQEF